MDMRKTAIMLGFFGCLISLNGLAQKSAKKPAAKTFAATKTDPFVFTYGADTVYRTEFLRQLNKNRKETALPSEKELNDYLNLYVNFKLKVKEALSMELDTNPAFKSELAGYRKQLATPYMSDKKVTEGLMQEAYERMKTEVNASHILINCNPNASASDSLAAWNKISDLRKRAAKGENFDSLAVKYSDDPSAKKNYGKLGWFTVFQMVYPFENVAYKLNKGEISMPFRTQFGYHIMILNEKRPARGEVKVQHIMIRTGYGTALESLKDARDQIDSVYAKLNKGETFESLAERYSQDEGSKGNKGTMSWMASLSGYPENFKDICFSLNPNETSKPFQTDFGWHIVRYVDRRPLGEFKDVQDIIKNKVSKDSRSEGSKAAVIARVKKEGNYTVNEANLKMFLSKLDTNFIKGNWKYDSNEVANKELFTIGNRKHYTRDFAQFLSLNQKPVDKGNAAIVGRKNFDDWASEKCLAYEESVLESKYEEFRNIMQEYHDGILLFDLTDKKVWGKALSDTLGLEKFYGLNKTKYMWKERLVFKTYNCLDAKTKQAAMKMFVSGKTEDEVFKKINKKLVGTISGKITRAEQNDPTAGKMWDKKGVVDISSEDGSHKFYYVEGVIAPEPKELKEAKGLVTSDYQEFLMDVWIKELRGKYAVTYNQAEISKMAGK
jgi:peptidyl-prolyl cis-trans isomerase SurA